MSGETHTNASHVQRTFATLSWHTFLVYLLQSSIMAGNFTHKKDWQNATKVSEKERKEESERDSLVSRKFIQAQSSVVVI